MKVHVIFAHVRRHISFSVGSRIITIGTTTSNGKGTKIIPSSNQLNEKMQQHRFMSTLHIPHSIRSALAMNDSRGDILRIQVRSMLTKKFKRSKFDDTGIPPLQEFSKQRQPRSGRGGGNQNVKGGGGNFVKLQICHTDYDLGPIDEDLYDDDDGEDEDFFYSKVNFDINAIKAKVEESLNTSKQLEYHNGKNWRPLERLGDITKYKGGKEPLRVRVRSLYDETFMNDKGKPHDDEYLDNDISSSIIIDTIDRLVLALKKSGYERSDSKVLAMTQKSTKTEILTKDWVLRQAEKDLILESVLLNLTASLDHIVHCLHYDMVWKRSELDDLFLRENDS